MSDDFDHGPQALQAALLMAIGMILLAIGCGLADQERRAALAKFLIDLG